MATEKPQKPTFRVRLSRPGQKKVRDLRQVYGSNTTVLEVALDRLWCSEFGDPADAKLTRPRE